MKVHPIVLAYMFNNKTMMLLQHCTKGERLDIWDVSKNNTLGEMRNNPCGDQELKAYRWTDFKNFPITFYFADNSGIPEKISFGWTEQHTLFVTRLLDPSGVLQLSLKDRSGTEIIYRFDENERLMAGKTLAEKYINRFNPDQYLPYQTVFMERLEEPGDPDYPFTVSMYPDCMGIPQVADFLENFNLLYDDGNEFIRNIGYKSGDKTLWSIDLEGIRASL